MVVVGASGLGKSRPAWEFLRERSEAAEVWIGRADPMAAGSAFGLLAQALRRAMGILDGEPLEVRRRKVLARVERLGELGAKAHTSRRSSASWWRHPSPARAMCSSRRRARAPC
ncbi:hypothetical protein WMF11_28920 [Sorangium sp. So ce295]|uniref:hypothetical protein n=1 Tax=Sorangium sp. So ce295 TaxID=3133295 RepID=UPI003F5FE12A